MIIEMTIDFSMVFIECNVFLESTRFRTVKYKFNIAFITAETIRMEPPAHCGYDAASDRPRA